MMRKFLLALACSVTLMIGAPVAALAATPTTGQPGANHNPPNTCAPDGSMAPGASATAPGSAFNPSGQAGNVYAGNPGTASSSHSNSSASVSEYDIACFRP
jgi:hypothetical protein